MKRLKDCLSNEEIEAFTLDDDWKALDTDNLRLLRMKLSSTWIKALKIEHPDLDYWKEFLDQVRAEMHKRKD